MKFKSGFYSFLAGFLPLLAIVLVQLTDYLYFKYLHNGLKFPDYFLFMFLVIILSWKFILKRDLKDLIGISINNWKKIKENFIFGLKYGLIVVFLALVLGLLFFEINYSLNLEYLKSMSYLIIGYLFFIPISAFCEELHYRGIYLKSFSQKYAVYFFLLFSSIIFSLVHIYLISDYTPYYLINMFFLGIILSFLMIRKDNLIVCTGFHSAWNFFLILLSPLFNSTSERYVEFSYTTTIILVLVTCYEGYIFWKEKYSKKKKE